MTTRTPQWRRSRPHLKGEGGGFIGDKGKSLVPPQDEGRHTVSFREDLYARGRESYGTLRLPSGGRERARGQETQRTPGVQDFNEWKEAHWGEVFDMYDGSYCGTGPPRGGAGVNPAWNEEGAVRGGCYRQAAPGPLNVTQEEGDEGEDRFHIPFTT